MIQKIDLENFKCHKNFKDDTAFQICNYEQMLEDMEKPNFLWTKNFYYLNAERIGPRITYGIKNTLDDYVGSKGEYTSYIINEIDKNQRLDSDMILPDLLKISSITRFSANCEEWLKLLFPNTALQSSVDMEKNISIIKFRNEGEFYLPRQPWILNGCLVYVMEIVC